MTSVTRQADVKDVTGTWRKAWFYTYQGETYRISEAAEGLIMLIQKGDFWKSVQPDQQGEVLEALRAEWRAGNVDNTMKD